MKKDAHALTVEENYRRFPGPEFSKKARWLVQPSQEGTVRDAQMSRSFPGRNEPGDRRPHNM